MDDTEDAGYRDVAERAAGKEHGGSIDLIWINGENFAAMKAQELLYGPFTDVLPNFRLVDFDNKPTTLVDFTVPTDGYESPWGMAKLNFIYDSARVGKRSEERRVGKEWVSPGSSRWSPYH